MKPEIKRKWLEALRSGQYKQTSGCLTDGERFCCLGVLTNLYLLEKGETWLKDEGGVIGVPEDDGLETSGLPEAVCDWAGLRSNDPLVGVATLAAENDTGTKFPQIADLIERHL